MRGLPLHVDFDHPDDLNLPALHLYAEVIHDAVDLVRGVRHARATIPTRPCDVAAARAWIRDGDVGVLTFDDACGWLGWDAEVLRHAIFSPPRAAPDDRIG